MPASAVETDLIWFLDTLARVHVSGGDTDERMALVEMLAPRGHTPPLHVHHAEDETFVLLEGEIAMYIGDAVFSLSAGTTAFGPKGVPHTFRVESETARWLVATAPAGFERFLRAAGLPASAAELPNKIAMPDPEWFDELCREYGIELLGPPGTLPS